MRMIITLGLAALVAAGSAMAVAQSAVPSSASRNAPVVYARDIAPILASSCATCHVTGAEAGRMSLVPRRAIASLVGVPSVGVPALKRVVPGKPAQSYLMMKLEGTHMRHGGTGARMPFGAPPLSAERIALFRRWIAQGARP